MSSGFDPGTACMFPLCCGANAMHASLQSQSKALSMSTKWRQLLPKPGFEPPTSWTFAECISHWSTQPPVMQMACWHWPVGVKVKEQLEADTKVVENEQVWQIPAVTCLSNANPKFKQGDHSSAIPTRTTSIFRKQNIVFSTTSLSASYLHKNRQQKRLAERISLQKCGVAFLFALFYTLVRDLFWIQKFLYFGPALFWTLWSSSQNPKHTDFRVFIAHSESR